MTKMTGNVANSIRWTVHAFRTSAKVKTFQLAIKNSSVISFFLHFSPPSVPCPPEDVQTVLDCSNNTALVEWQASSGADFYIVQAFGIEEDITGCESASQSCELTDLMCGFTYNISVIAVNSQCNVSQSGVTQLKTGKDNQRDVCDMWRPSSMIISLWWIVPINLKKKFFFGNIWKYFGNSESWVREVNAYIYCVYLS